MASANDEDQGTYRRRSRRRGLARHDLGGLLGAEIAWAAALGGLRDVGAAGTGRGQADCGVDTRCVGRRLELGRRSDRAAAAGYDVRAIANPLENLTTDAESVAAFLRSINGPIVLVGHSYGGAVITQAAAGIPNVKALVYVDAAAPDVGETNGSLSGADSVLKQKPEAELFDKLPEPGAPAGTSDLYLKKDIFLHNFGNDLPADVATRLWATQRVASTGAFDTPATQAAWKTIPSWYFISSGDQIITPTSETAMAERATFTDHPIRRRLAPHPDLASRRRDRRDPKSDRLGAVSGWDSRRRAKAERITAGAAHCDGKVIKPGNLADLLHSVIQPGDRVALEGDNQKQADFLSRTLADCDPQRLHDLHMLISSVSRPEHLDLFERGIATKLDLAYAGPQSVRIAQTGRGRDRADRRHPHLRRAVRPDVRRPGTGRGSAVRHGRRPGRQPVHRPEY